MTKRKKQKKAKNKTSQQHRTYSNKRQEERGNVSVIPKVDSAEKTHPPLKRIEVQQLNSPQRFNRTAFQGYSDGIREESLNYYLPTSILHAVKNILDFPMFKLVKERLNRGEYSQPKKDKIAHKVDKIAPVIYLDKTMDKEKIDYMYDQEGYMICQPYEINGSWEIISYLYRTYSLDGFADIKVDGLGYRLRSEVIPQWNVDLSFFCFATNGITGEGPIQVTSLEAEYGRLLWLPNSEADLAGYNVYYSLGTIFNYIDGMDDCSIGCIPVGNVTEFLTLTNPDPMYQALLGSGVAVSYGVAALDDSGNRSGVTYRNSSGDYVTENFTQDLPPTNPGGLGLSN
jgi:hypothetical protein